jgi:hypothetical protein
VHRHLHEQQIGGGVATFVIGMTFDAIFPDFATTGKTLCPEKGGCTTWLTTQAWARWCFRLAPGSKSLDSCPTYSASLCASSARGKRAWRIWLGGSRYRRPRKRNLTFGSLEKDVKTQHDDEKVISCHDKLLKIENQTAQLQMQRPPSLFFLNKDSVTIL